MGTLNEYMGYGSACLPLWLVLSGVSVVAGAQSHPWEIFEVEMTARGEYANAYLQPPPARVVFRSAAGKSYTIVPFWDGAKSWRARFAPPSPGQWTYESSSTDLGLNGVKGSFACADWTEAEKQSVPTRRGVVQVAPDGHHFQYADGVPFLWIGDTWWNWGKKGILFSSFQKLAGDRAAKGFTIGQMFLPGNGLVDSHTNLPDFDQIRKVEQFIAYANAKGITVWIHPWWSGKSLGGIGPEKIKRWWRYVISRFGSYNVVWVLAGEYNMDDYGSLGLPFWKELGAMVRAEDPYRRIIGAHPTPPGWKGGADAPQWSTGEALHKQPWLDYNQSQVGHGKWRNEMIPQIIAADYARVPAKPTIVTEPWYEFIKGNPPAADIRFGAWSAILSGAAGHTYGGGSVWWANVPESPSKQGAWPKEPDFQDDTLNYPGAVSMAFLAHFLKSIEWWKLAPHPESVSDYPAKFCSSVPGREYVVYVRWGGTLKLDLRPSGAGDNFRYTWYDLVESKQRRSGSVQGGAVRELQAPEDYPAVPQFKDWLLHIRRSN